MNELISNYLAEIKSSVKLMVNQLKDYGIPNNWINEIFEAILCVDGNKTQPEEAIELIVIQLPEILHCKDAFQVMQNMAGLFAGSMDYLFENNKEELKFQAKNIVREEFIRFELESQMYKEVESSNVDNLFENFNLNK
jgi:hypothetical protein